MISFVEELLIKWTKTKAMDPHKQSEAMGTQETQTFPAVAE
jgi:hypothetical protein